jgi:Sensors of blue-light using FAD
MSSSHSPPPLEQKDLARKGHKMQPQTDEFDQTDDFDIDQILYCSLLSEPMDESEITELVHHAANLNRMDHITGLLMHADGVFVQLIEGPRQAIEHL